MKIHGYRLRKVLVFELERTLLKKGIKMKNFRYCSLLILVLLVFRPDASECPAANPPVIVISPIPSRCVDGANLFLNNYVTVDGFFRPGGIWTSTSPGLFGDRFDPKVSGTGKWRVFYEFTDTATKLTSKDSEVVTINALPVVFAGNDSMVCTGGGKFVLFGSPSMPQGIWRGLGVEYSTGKYYFNPDAAGIVNGGIYIAIYRYTDSNYCINEDTVNITVYRTPVVDAGPDQNTMVNSTPVVLTGTPAGGFWSGPGVSGNIFDPSKVGTGVYHLVYTYVNVICVGRDTMTVTVMPVSVPGSDSPDPVKIFPNPASGYVVISVNENLTGIESVRLLNALGLNIMCLKNIKDSDIRIAGDCIEKGMYLLEIQLTDKTMIYRRIIFK